MKLCLVVWLVWAYIWNFEMPRHFAKTSWEGWGQRAKHLIPLVLGNGAIFYQIAFTPLYTFHLYQVVEWSGYLLTAVGLGWTFLSRNYLGIHWSPLVEVREGAELVTSGPYAVVRHPIYLGLVLAMFGTMLVASTPGAVLGWLLFVLAFVIKSSHEDKMLSESFPFAYSVWKWHTPNKIIPGVY